jgi:thiol-disulfide isomerase/thioredoxin
MRIRAVLVALSLVGCDRGGETAPSARSEAVTAASDMPAAAPSMSAATAHATPAAARILCESELAQPGRHFPKSAFTPVSATGATPLTDKVPAGGARWTWINLFASWCGPCKEEMPRLRGFQERLAAKLQVTFVSLDDDERLLKKFLEASSVRSAMWLQPGKPREAWLGAFQLKDPPDLPVHVLVDPTGKVRCVVGGAVEDGDFERIAKIVGR